MIVELFTSEGCSSCPPADNLMRQLAEKGSPDADLVLLSEHVDYWDHLGWKDRFASEEFTARQREYAFRFRLDGPYTPQMVVDGQRELIGSDAAELRTAIASAAKHPKPVQLRLKWDAALQTATISAEGKARGYLYVAITEDALSTPVKAGENHGRTLQHTAVVRYMHRAKLPETAPSVVHIPIMHDWNPEHLNLVAFVEDSRSGSLIGASSIPAR